MEIRPSGSQPSGKGPADYLTGMPISHIAIQEKLNGSPVTWMEHVTDEQYRR